MALLITGCSADRPAITDVSVTARAKALVARMTLDEKIAQLHGVRTSTEYRYVPPLPRLGIPALLISNGPAGVGVGASLDPATALPAPIALAATFDTDAATTYGTVEGSELADTGRNLLEGPTVNIARVPRAGRVFEGYGEDPYLSGRMAAANIRGIQGQGVLANVKHYLGNNQETERMTGNDVIDERTMHEIYLPAFEAAVKDGHAASVMCAYPRVNGVYACANGGVLDGVLKRDWGFDGFVTSDFGAVHDTVGPANAGLDLELPTGKYFGDALKAAIQAGTVKMSTVDDKLVRRYRQMMLAGLFDRKPTTKPIPAQADGLTARRLAEAGTVLLKNDRALLPLPATTRTVALIGPRAGEAWTGGGGTAWVKPAYTVAPIDGLRAHGAQVSHVDGAALPAAVAAARHADVAVVMVGDDETEGKDRPSLTLPGNQDALVAAVAAANPRTVVVVKSGGPVLMPWLDKVPAVVEAWYPGEEDGNVVAAVLYGDVNPSGRLPVTFPRAEADAIAPGVGGTVSYSEGVFVGYRHYDAAGVAPLFPFGYGLSYTTFRYANLSITAGAAGRVAVSADVTNTGTRSGAEVVQLYVGDPAPGEPPAQLKGFTKVTLAPGATAHVSFTLDSRAFSYWDVGTHGWRVAGGTYRIDVGASSRDFRLRGTVRR
jgi:beta-glucosidase